ncbi:MAG TPA: hypothetical protein DET40_26165 [Lentisphaeria bacterium]|nr:MAG: hypothetical protein A2X45_11690 [Lentisphaerae bacterium GWF2_50_93]HCE47048.1 hypothetical protein [Lentisphaeria bacterium]
MGTSMKHILHLLVITSVLILAAGCFSFRKENNDRNIVQMVEHLKKSGMAVDSVQPTLFDVIRAQDGISMKIDGADVQIYKYDTTVEAQKEKIERIRQKGIITILGVEFPAKVNGSFIMLKYSGHPEEPKLVEAFESF